MKKKRKETKARKGKKNEKQGKEKKTKMQLRNLYMGYKSSTFMFIFCLLPIASLLPLVI